MKNFRDSLFLFALAALVPVQALAAKIGDNTLIVNRPGSTASKTLQLGTSTQGVIRYDTTANKLRFANDGASFKDLGSGSGAGGINLLANNPDAESGTANWTASGGSFTTTGTAANVGDGSNSFSFTPSAISQTVTSDAYTVGGGLDSNSCLAAIYYKTAEAVNSYVLNAVQGASTVIGTAILPPTGGRFTWGYASFPCPVLGQTVKLQVAAPASLPTNPIYFDRAKLGEEDRTFSASQAKNIGSMAWAPTGCGGFLSTSTSMADFPSNAGCAAATRTTTGIVTDTSGGQRPEFGVPYLLPGHYTVKVAGLFGQSSSASTQASQTYWQLHDGTNPYGTVGTRIDAAPNTSNVLSGYVPVLVYDFDITTAQGAKTFKLQSQLTGSSLRSIIDPGTTGLKFTIDYIPSASETGMRVDSMGWHVDASISGSAPVLALSGSGSDLSVEDSNLTLTNNPGNGVIPATIPCAGSIASTGATCSGGNESVGIIFNTPIAGDVLACANFTESLSTGGSATVYNGNWQLTTTGLTSPVAVKSGNSYPTTGINMGSSQQIFWPMRVCGNFTLPAGPNAIRLKYAMSQSAAALTSHTVAATIHWEVYPVNFTSGALPIFKGMVSSIAAGRIRHEYGHVYNVACSSSPCTITGQSGFVSQILRTGTGVYDVQFNVGAFSAAPACVVGGGQSPKFNTNPSTSGFTFRMENTSGTATDSTFDFICTGPN